jgi:ribose transport system permease protein
MVRYDVPIVTAIISIMGVAGLLGALIGGLGTGFLIGLINGLLVTKIVIPSFWSRWA